MGPAAISLTEAGPGRMGFHARAFDEASTSTSSWFAPRGGFSAAGAGYGLGGARHMSGRVNRVGPAAPASREPPQTQRISPL